MRSYCPCSLDCFCGDKRYVTAADSHPGREGGREGKHILGQQKEEGKKEQVMESVSQKREL